MGDGINPPPGIVNAPGATFWARVMVVSGNARDARLSQVAALACAEKSDAQESATTANRQVNSDRFGSIVRIDYMLPLHFPVRAR
jgi:hypothetical protein